MLLAIEGFDFYNNGGEILQRSGMLQWTQNSAGDMAAGRIDGTGRCFSVTTNTLALRASLATNINTGFFGMAINMSTASGPALYVFGARESNSGQDQFSIVLHGDDLSISYPGGRTTNNLFPLNTWFFLEIGFVISKTAGSIRVRINGVTVLDLTGLNTSPNTTNLWMNGFSISARDFATTLVDDIYICDNITGPGAHPCNGFLGDRRVYTLRPSAPGDSTAWTGSVAGNANWSHLITSDDDASYTSSSTVGAEDLFNLSDLPASVTDVIAVQVTGRYKKVDATAHTLTQRIKAGGVDAPGVGFLAPYALSTTYVYYSDVFTINPGTSAAWTPSAVNAAQIGYKLET